MQSQQSSADADRGFTLFAAAVLSFDATAAMGEEGMAVAMTRLMVVQDIDETLLR
jgi:hypothetical protein